MVLSAGCTSYFSNLTAAKKNLQLNEYAVFEKEGNKFTAEITDIKGVSSGTRLNQVDITIRVRGAGNKPVSLVAYPSLSDPSGEVYWGKNIFIGMVSPGGEFSGKSTIPIPTDEAFSSLKKGARLNLRFQDTKLIPYEGTWEIDITKI
ncbi:MULTISPECIES: hypothetical protein [unclassified Methanoregula]|uniref:hypothetical protein n=1 Tax=unclassified Methanoregula TaxID=2649730 RepID=UPI0025F1A465|nr:MULTISPECIES: hypothetical protein [unclassified Methanoregula]